LRATRVREHNDDRSDEENESQKPENPVLHGQPNARRLSLRISALSSNVKTQRSQS
jgi:hypothetical protein